MNKAVFISPVVGPRAWTSLVKSATAATLPIEVKEDGAVPIVTKACM